VSGTKKAAGGVAEPPVVRWCVPGMARWLDHNVLSIISLSIFVL